MHFLCTSRFQSGTRNLKKSINQMKGQEESRQRQVEFEKGDLVLLKTGHLCFQGCLQKL